MRTSSHTALPWMLLAVTTAGADADSVLLDRVRSKVMENMDRLPRYTCVQRIERSRFQEVPLRWRSCRDLLDTHSNAGRPAALLVSTNWLRLDVTVVRQSDIFTWAGGERFETGDVDVLVGYGLSGSGDYAAFCGNIFGGGDIRFLYRGEYSDGGRKLGQFSYRVPLEASHYQMKLADGNVKTMGFDGEFWVDKESGDLVRLTVEIVNPPRESEVCSAGSEMLYQRVRIGDADFMLPEVTRLHMLYTGGNEAHNETRYQSCHEFLGESTLRFDAPSAIPESIAKKKEPLEIPPDLVLRIALATPIDSAKAAAGDPVDAKLVEPLLDGSRKVLLRAGTIVHGRIMRLEQRFLPLRIFLLGLRFDAIEVEGLRQPVSLRFWSGKNGWRDGVQQFQYIPVEKRPFVGTFPIREKYRFHLDHHFVTEWRTVGPAVPGCCRPSGRLVGRARTSAYLTVRQ
jgi:hypothetical protein